VGGALLRMRAEEADGPIEWAQDLSPFTHISKAPAVPVTAAPVLALLAVVAALVLTGLVSLRRRDLALPA
jgi:ABC-2 type transport system permease protein